MCVTTSAFEVLNVTTSFKLGLTGGGVTRKILDVYVDGGSRFPGEEVFFCMGTRLNFWIDMPVYVVISIADHRRRSDKPTNWRHIAKMGRLKTPRGSNDGVLDGVSGVSQGQYMDFSPRGYEGLGR